MAELKGYTGGEALEGLEVTIRFVDEPRTTSKGVVQDTLLIGDDGGSLGFPLWVSDYPGVGDGDTIILSGGYVTLGDYAPHKGKLIVKMKRAGTVTVTGKEVGTPAPLPPQAQAALDAANGVVEADAAERRERDKQFARRDCLKAAATFYAGAGTHEEGPVVVLDAARYWYAWVMGDEDKPAPALPPAEDIHRAPDGTFVKYVPADYAERTEGFGGRTGESKWNTLTSTISKAKKEIPYYEDNAFHIIGALGKLEKEGVISWTETPVKQVFDALNAYAHKRANEKAAE